MYKWWKLGVLGIVAVAVPYLSLTPDGKGMILAFIVLLGVSEWVIVRYGHIPMKKIISRKAMMRIGLVSALVFPALVLYGAEYRFSHGGQTSFFAAFFVVLAALISGFTAILGATAALARDDSQDSVEPETRSRPEEPWT